MLRVLTYHRIAEENEFQWLDPSLISATPKDFDRQMYFLSTHYQVVSIENVLNAFTAGKPLPKRAVLLTFDDGYQDFAQNAWPVLKRHRLPATLFVPTAYLSDPFACFWWDRLYQSGYRNSRGLQQRLKAMPHSDAMRIVDELSDKSTTVNYAPSLLAWDQIRRLAREGVAIGSHSRTHPVLTQISRSTLEDETAGSQKDLRSELGFALPVFCYPSGYWNSGVAETLATHAISLAFSTQPGHNDVATCNRLALGRINITRRTTFSIFRLRLMSVGSVIDQWRPGA